MVAGDYKGFAVKYRIYKWLSKYENTLSISKKITLHTLKNEKNKIQSIFHALHRFVVAVSMEVCLSSIDVHRFLVAVSMEVWLCSLDVLHILNTVGKK